MQSEDGSDSLQIDNNAKKAESVSDSSALRKRSADGTNNNVLSKKRIVVIDVADDVEASMKGHHVDTSSEVVALQEKLKRLEKMFQGACRMTREAELRAEYAESIIDSKRGVKDSIENEKQKNEQLQKKLDEVSAQLEEERNLGKARAEADKKLIDEAVRKRQEVERRLTASGRGDEREMALYRENETLKREMANMSRIMESMNGCHNCSALQSRIDDLTGQLSESERKQRVAHIAIIDLTSRLREMENNPLRETEVTKKSKAEKGKAKAASNQNIRDYITSELATVTKKSNDPLAILMPCSTPGEYVDASSAAHFLRYKFHKECNKEELYRKMKKTKVQCCGKRPGAGNFLAHIGSKKHCQKMGQRGGGVSKAALAYWIDLMEESRENRIMEEAQKEEEETADTTAAAEKSGGILSWLFSWAKPVKKEIKEEIKEEEEEEWNENNPSHSTNQPSVIPPSGPKKEIKKEEC